MGGIVSCFSNNNGVSMVTCIIGITSSICLPCLCRNHIIRSVSIITCGYAVVMFSPSAASCIMAVLWKFSDSFLSRPEPAINSNVWLHIIVRCTRTSIFDTSNMGMITSIFGIDTICSRTIGVSYTVRSFFVIVAIYSMIMISC